MLVVAYTGRKLHYLFSPPRAPNQYVTVAKLSGLLKGHYSLSVFVLEKDGLPFNRSAIVPQNVTVNQEGMKEYLPRFYGKSGMTMSLYVLLT